MARCALFLALGKGLLATDDSVTLLQQGASVAVIARDVPDPGPDGFLMDRVSSYAEPGGKIEFSLGAKCSEADEAGPKECSMRWGEVVNGQCKLHIPGGIRKGDTIVGGMSMQMKPQNMSDIGALLFPKTVEFSTKCGVCAGRCISEAQTEDTKLYVSGPSVLVDDTHCGSDQVVADEDFTVINVSGAMPSLATLMLDGTATVTMGLEKADGTKRVEGSYALKAKSRPSLPSHKPLSLLSLMTERVAEAISLSASAEQKKALQQAAEGASAPAGGSGFLGLTIDVKHREDAKNSLTLKAGQACEATDDKGSMKCKLPMNSNVDLSSALNLKMHLDEGSVVRMKVKAKMGGLMGGMISGLVPKVGIEMPLCGKATDISLMGQKVHVEPPKCGDYELRVESLKPSSMTVPDLVSLALPKTPGVPFMPKTLAELLPMDFGLSLEMKHANGDIMLAADIAASATKK